MASDYYINRDGRTKEGPFSSRQLKQLAAAGKLSQSDLVWKEGFPKWVPASEIKGLFPAPAQDSGEAEDIRVPCCNCGNVILFPSEEAGEVGTCCECGARLRVPTLQQAAYQQRKLVGITNAVAECVSCRAAIEMPPEFAGLTVRCPNCGNPTPIEPPEQQRKGNPSVLTPRAAATKWGSLAIGCFLASCFSFLSNSGFAVVFLGPAFMMAAIASGLVWLIKRA